MTIASKFVEGNRNIVQLMTVLSKTLNKDDLIVAVDQDFDAETTTWIFKDKSKIVIHNTIVTVLDLDTIVSRVEFEKIETILFYCGHCMEEYTLPGKSETCPICGENTLIET